MNKPCKVYYHDYSKISDVNDYTAESVDFRSDPEQGELLGWVNGIKTKYVERIKPSKYGLFELQDGDLKLTHPMQKHIEVIEVPQLMAVVLINGTTHQIEEYRIKFD